MLQQDILQQNISISLPYSSLLFNQKVKEWTEKNPNFFRKRERQTERAALKYLSRASAKTSPFAAFTTLQIATNQLNTHSSIKNKKNINVKILDIICELLPTIKAIRKQLFVTINDTCFSEKNSVFFIQNKHNTETLQELEEDDTVLFFIAFFEENKTVQFDKLCEYLEDEAAETFLLQLIEMGFLCYKMPFLKHFDAFFVIKELLESVKSEIDIAEKTTYDKLTSLCDLFFQEKTIDNFELRQEEFFYLDTPSSHSELDTYNEQLSGLYDSISTTFCNIQKIVYPLYISELSQKINTFLAQTPLKEISIIELYKAIFHKENSLDNRISFDNKQQQLICNFFFKKIPRNDDFIVNISAEILYEITTFVTSVSEKKDNLCSPSVNLILQPFRENGHLKAVLNGASVGFGKQFARFLPLFDDKISADFKTENLENPFVLAELNDASFFNANQHPHLLDYGISAPNTLHFSEQNILTKNLTIKQIDNEWILFDQEKKQRVIPLDLGIEHPSFRSPFYQLLHFFSYKIANFRIFNDFINEQYSAHKKPRICIDNQTITQRMTWFFNISELPFLQKNQSENDYFSTVQTWQNNNDLPNLVYVSIPHFQPQNGLSNQSAAPQGDDYKPQMIDFQNPLLVSLFARILKKVPSRLVIEEMLPTEEQLFDFDGKKYVMEAVVQVRNNFLMNNE